jgi:hypothetical protein
LIAAVAPSFVPNTTLMSLSVSPISSSLILSHRGHIRSTCCTLIAAISHAYRLLQIRIVVRISHASLCSVVAVFPHAGLFLSVLPRFSLGLLVVGASTVSFSGLALSWFVLVSLSLSASAGGFFWLLFLPRYSRARRLGVAWFSLLSLLSFRVQYRASGAVAL